MLQDVTNVRFQIYTMVQIAHCVNLKVVIISNHLYSIGNNAFLNVQT